MRRRGRSCWRMRGCRCWARSRHRHHACHSHRAMGATKIRKRPRAVEGVREGSSLVENPRVPDSVRCARSTRSGAVTARAPAPLHCIPRIDRHRCRGEEKAAVAHRHCDGNPVCHARAQSQNGSNNRDHQRRAAVRGPHCVTHSTQLQTICCPQAIQEK